MLTVGINDTWYSLSPADARATVGQDGESSNLRTEQMKQRQPLSMGTMVPRHQPSQHQSTTPQAVVKWWF